ncbi:mechanosensitive ion channel [Silicimonas algicola]|uniref:Mechanosensitive ion channel-like protein n=1 Tax=Silicimonas algicola TaxID=1826607 RepID=A0A316G495_9RHOB|nr:mechanosensitive ion channel domain-containing protein [Silicimonas algicola]AZQ68539.1 mechanosensitive ion channel [Silicimonas algicola]PWK55751.1 mechanosensitive ion channel-like protein [Silicimonas algicola]
MDADLWTQLADLWNQALLQGRLLLQPSRLYQIGILVVCIAFAWGVSRWIKPHFNAWMHTLEGRPKWQLRWLLLIRRRIFLMAFTLFVWIAARIMAEINPFPSRRFLLELVGTIAIAILLVGLAARLVRNELLRRIVSWALWIFVTLYYLGVADEASRLLDSLAIDIGDFHLSILTVIQAAAAIAVLFTLARLISQTTANRIRANDDISPSMQVLAVKILQILLFGAAFFIGLKFVGVDLTGLAVLSGAIGVGLGFGLQKVVSNLVSGVIILLDKSIKPGDVISIGDTFGWINALGARYVSITTRDGKEYLIPNEDLITGQVVNWSHSNDFVRIDIDFGTSYDDDPHKVRKLAIEAAASVNRVLSSRPPVCHITGFGDSSVNYILRFWIVDPSDGLTNIRGNVFLALWDTFKANGISIPFPQREVRVLNDSLAVTRSEAQP